MLKLRPEFLVGGLAVVVVAVTYYMFSQIDGVKKQLQQTQKYNQENRETLVKLNNLIQLQLSEAFSDDEYSGDEEDEYDDEEEFSDDEQSETETAAKTAAKFREISEKMEQAAAASTLEHPVISKRRGNNRRRDATFTLVSTSVVSPPEKIASDSDSDAEQRFEELETASDRESDAETEVEVETEAETEAGGNDGGVDNDAEDAGPQDDGAEPDKCPATIGGKRNKRQCGQEVCGSSGFCRKHASRGKTLKVTSAHDEQGGDAAA